MLGGIRSNGSAPTLYAGSTKMDNRILQDQDFYHWMIIPCGSEQKKSSLVGLNH